MAGWVVILSLLAVAGALARPEQAGLGELTAKLGEKFWSAPEKRLIRATIYQKGPNAEDPASARARGDCSLGLRYATEKEAGTLAVPKWLPRGSMVKIHTEKGVFSYIAADDLLPQKF